MFKKTFISLTILGIILMPACKNTKHDITTTTTATTTTTTLTTPTTILDETGVDFSKLELISLQLSDLGFTDKIVGFDTKGNIALWVNAERSFNGNDIKKYNIPKPTIGYDLSYNAKKIFDEIKEVYKVWMNWEDDIYNYCLHIDRNMYKQSGLDQSTSISSYFNNIKPINQIVCSYWYSEYPDLFFDPSQASICFENIFGNRLKSYTIDYDNDAYYINATIEGLPQGDDISINVSNEIANVLVSSIGRYANHYWDSIALCAIDYVSNEKVLLDIAVLDREYKDWYENGLKQHDWINYLEPDSLIVYDDRINLPDIGNSDITQEVIIPGEVDWEYEYNKALLKIQQYAGIELSLLGIYEDGLGAVININVSGDDRKKSYKLQMDISKDLISNTLVRYIWFFSDWETETELINIDKKRYDVLMYGRNDNKFDFEPKMWTTMAGSYWKTIKESN